MCCGFNVCTPMGERERGMGWELSAVLICFHAAKHFALNVTSGQNLSELPHPQTTTTKICKMEVITILSNFLYTEHTKI